MQAIRLRGAHHNLQGVDLDLHAGETIRAVVTSVSSAGKSSLALDTLLFRGFWQRFVESFSPYALPGAARRPPIKLARSVENRH
jgi:excinuclease UvrABC ATPase subunit